MRYLNKNNYLIQKWALVLFITDFELSIWFSGSEPLSLSKIKSYKALKTLVFILSSIKRPFLTLIKRPTHYYKRSEGGFFFKKIPISVRKAEMLPTRSITTWEKDAFSLVDVSPPLPSPLFSSSCSCWSCLWEEAQEQDGEREKLIISWGGGLLWNCVGGGVSNLGESIYKKRIFFIAWKKMAIYFYVGHWFGFALYEGSGKIQLEKLYSLDFSRCF